MLTYEVSKLETPVGTLEIAATQRGLARIRYVTWPVRAAKQPLFKRASEFAIEARFQLEQYFAGERTTFNIPLDFSMSSDASIFKQRVWAVLSRVPYGTRVSYADLAKKVGRPGGAQAIGQAMKLNPIPIVVPCHRVVPSEGLDPKTGVIGSYNGGVKRKSWLLSHEQQVKDRLAGKPIKISVGSVHELSTHNS